MFLTGVYSVGIIYAIVISVWASVMVEGWKRSQQELAHLWSSLDTTYEEEYRPEFVGDNIINSYSGRMDKFFPKLRRSSKFLLTAPPIACLLAIAIFSFWLTVFLKSLTLQAQLDNFLTTFISLCIASLYGAFITLLNSLYAKMALQLTRWENHETTTSFENSLILKTFCFQFVNSYISLFYAAFVLCDINYLSFQLLGIMVGEQSIDLFIEYVYPRYLVDRRLSKWGLSKSKALLSQRSTLIRRSSHVRMTKLPSNTRLAVEDLADSANANNVLSALNSLNNSKLSFTEFIKALALEIKVGREQYDDLRDKDPREVIKYLLSKAQENRDQLKDAEKKAAECESLELLTSEQLQSAFQVAEVEYLLESAVEPCNAYASSMIQFGYIVFFSSACPILALFALANNVIRIRMEAQAVCSVRKRTFGKSTSGIGMWLSVLQFMSFLAVVVNCGIIMFTNSAFIALFKSKSMDCNSCLMKDATGHVMCGSWNSTVLQCHNYQPVNSFSTSLSQVFGSNPVIQQIMLVILVEHIIIVIKVLIAEGIEDTPEWVSNALSSDKEELFSEIEVARLMNEVTGQVVFGGWRKDHKLLSKMILKTPSVMRSGSSKQNLNVGSGEGEKDVKLSPRIEEGDSASSSNTQGGDTTTGTSHTPVNTEKEK